MKTVKAIAFTIYDNKKENSNRNWKMVEETMNLLGYKMNLYSENSKENSEHDIMPPVTREGFSRYSVRYYMLDKELDLMSSYKIIVNLMEIFEISGFVFDPTNNDNWDIIASPESNIRICLDAK